VCDTSTFPAPKGSDECAAAHTESRKLAREQRHYKDALQRIVDFPINEKASAGWHFAEVRRIAREALGDV